MADESQAAMTMPPQPPSFEPSTPDPVLTDLILMALRWGVMVLSGAGVGFASKIPDSGLSVIAQGVSGLVFVGMAMWAYFAKRRAAARDHAGSVESARRSAQSGVPTPVRAV